ncbi:hypothetical protein [Thermomonospora catenispora]|uniref:hypothetical protein n=1 Tax=Thermomonospora catenispora TaxID=2493090 RepID=UPI0019D56C7F|nr:hypothetical protein [Thermomonospora catenispora]
MATRLHPRPGTPTVHDGSVGGPLLWPADELAERVRLWAKREGLNYEGDVATAPGWKVGGWPAPWTFCGPPEPGELHCGCGAPLGPLLTIDSS